MRDILVLAIDLVNIIPNDHDIDNKFNILKRQIKKDIIGSIPYAEPDLVRSSWFWNKLSVFINNTISYDDYNNIPWCKKIIDIFQDPNYNTDPTSVNIY